MSKEPTKCKLEIDKIIIEPIITFNYFMWQLTRSRNIIKQVTPQANKAVRLSLCNYMKE